MTRRTRFFRALLKPLPRLTYRGWTLGLEPCSVLYNNTQSFLFYRTYIIAVRNQNWRNSPQYIRIPIVFSERDVRALAPGGAQRFAHSLRANALSVVKMMIRGKEREFAQAEGINV